MSLDLPHHSNHPVTAHMQCRFRPETRKLPSYPNPAIAFGAFKMLEESERPD